MNPSDELISVVIPTFNRAGTIWRAAISVLNQSHGLLELIVVDDASEDETVNIVNSIKDSRLRLIQHSENKGVGAARNTGIREARGRWVAFQDSDDEWLLQKLEKQANALRLDPNSVGVYCTKIFYGRGKGYHDYGTRRSSCVPGPEEKVLHGDIKDILYQKNLISTQTLVVKKIVAQDIGGFDENIKNNVDWDFVIRLAEKGSILFVDEPLVVTYAMLDSISRPSKKSVYSRLVIVNKMRRREVPDRVVARHLAALATQLSYYGKTRSARRLLNAAIKLDPTGKSVLARFAADRLWPVWSITAPWLGRGLPKRRDGSFSTLRSGMFRAGTRS